MANIQFMEAQQHFNSLMEKHPRNRKVYQNIIRFNERKLDYKGKLNVLNEMRREFPKDTAIVRDIAETLERMEKFGKARAMYDTLAAMSGKSLKPGLAIAETYVKQESLEAAIERYSDLRTGYPENIQLLKSYGESLKIKKLWKQALGVYQDLNELQSGEYVKRNLGYVHEKLGNEVTARVYYQESLDSNSQHPLPYFQLGKMLQKHGEED